EKAGGELASDPTELAKRELDIVFTMLPAAQHVRSVYLGENGLLAHGSPNTLFVDCSTIDPHTARDVAAQAQDKGITLIDAPVSGGTKGATEGTDRKSTRLNSSHVSISYAVFCLKKKKTDQ